MKSEWRADDYGICHETAAYDIPWARLEKPEAVIAWAMHLAEKSWVTKATVLEFMQLAAKGNGWQTTVF